MNPVYGLIVRVFIWLVICFFSLVGGISHAEQNTASSPPDHQERSSSALLEEIETGRKTVDVDSTLDDTRKQRVLGLYGQAALWLQQARKTQTERKQLVESLQQAPQRIKSIKSGDALIALDFSELTRVLQSSDLTEIEQELAQEDVSLQQARDRQKQQADELSNLLVGSKGLNVELAEKAKALERIESEIDTPPADEPVSVIQARQLMLKARLLLRQSELDLLKLRLSSHDLLTNLAQAERDFASSEIEARQNRLQALSEAAQALRETLAGKAVQEAEALWVRTEELPPALRSVAEENTNYRQELKELISREQDVSSALQVARLGLDEIKVDLERTRQRVEVAGASETIGKMLKRRRAELPSSRRYSRSSAERGVEISRATDRQIEIDELLRTVGDAEKRVMAAIAAASEAERDALQMEAGALQSARRDALNELQKIYSRYIGQVTSLDLAERQLVEVSGAYIDYIDDQLIWIPGPGLQSLIAPKNLIDAGVWLLAPERWQEVLQDIWSVAKNRAAWIASILVIFAILLRKHGRAEQRLEELTVATYKIRTDSLGLTLLALAHTLFLVSAWPVLLIGSGWIMATFPAASSYSLFIANGLIKAGLILFSLRFIIQICRPNGLGDRHLRWSADARAAVVKEFSWILPFAVPLGFLVAATASGETPPAAQSLGRLAFVVLMLVSAVMVYRLLRGKGHFMESVRQTGRHPTMVQLHFIWFPIVMLSTLAYAVTSAVGYHNTSLHLEQRGEQTFWFFVGLFLLKELLLRSLYVAERRFRLEDAVRRRDEFRAQREDAGDEEMSAISLDIPELDFDQLSEQNKRLVRAGFLFSAVIGIWSIWSDLLPALAFLNATELPFHASRVVDGIAREVPVTMGDLTLGLIIIGITVLAAKNIPGVLEIALLQRLPLDSGARYAITSLSQYAIAGFGVLFAFSSLGLQWSSIQWLVAALSVGLGFGLQEIVANFISGIILLFERPIRVGDVVTIDNTTGKVSRIRIRATTVINWDKQELLIPNKEFITGRVINWTLSDKINRVVITVGVAYGADVDKAMALLLEAARENSNVLADPEPVASFEAFGDNALTLLLRAYLGSMDYRLETITALHQAINDKFNDAGINIAFPQRDIHLETSAPLDIRLHRGPLDQS